jgi:CBS domain containing-hemolysin-like protein
METPWERLHRNPQDQMSDELLDYFSTHDFLVVVDDKKSVIGIVQLWDVARELWKGRANCGP